MSAHRIKVSFSKHLNAVIIKVFKQRQGEGETTAHPTESHPPDAFTAPLVTPGSVVHIQFQP